MSQRPAKMYSLTIDIGNTQTVAGCYDEGGNLLQSFRLQTDRRATSDELYAFLDNSLKRIGLHWMAVDRAVLATVVPELELQWRDLLKRLAPIKKLVSVDYKAPWSFDIDFPVPSQIGADRLANVEGGIKYGSPVILIDAGTAITFDIVDTVAGRPTYIGGVIIPGLEISLNALVGRTSRLPAVSLRKPPEDCSVVGKSTEAAIQSGLLNGFGCMIDGMVDRIRAERGFPESVPVISTGGHGYVIRKYATRVNEFSPDLTLEGLYAIAQKF